MEIACYDDGDEELIGCWLPNQSIISNGSEPKLAARTTGCRLDRSRKVEDEADRFG